MAKNKKARIPHKFLPWIAIRKQYNLTHAEVQMARELGLEPRRFPSYANIKDQPWKKPLKEFIAELYLKQTGREQPETVFSMEDLAAQHVARRLAKKQAKLERLASEAGEGDSSDAGEIKAEPVAEAVPQQAVAEPVENKPEPVAAEPIPAEPEPESAVVESVVAEPEPVPDPEPVAETPEPEPQAPAETPQPEAPPAASPSPWEAARARLNAKSKANPSDPDLTS